VRQAAVNALGLLGEHSAVESLCGLINDPDRDVRESVIAALGQICDPRAIVPLVPALLDVESSVRTAAAATLQKLDRHWENNKNIRQVVPKILEALKNPDYWVHHSAVKLLELLKIDPENPPVVAPVAAPEKPAQDTKAHPALAALTDMLIDRDRGFRLAAAIALGRLREKSARSILATALRDSDDAVRQEAQKALAALN
jgi:hypothetical protein